MYLFQNQLSSASADWFRSPTTKTNKPTTTTPNATERKKATVSAATKWHRRGTAVTTDGKISLPGRHPVPPQNWRSTRPPIPERTLRPPDPVQSQTFKRANRPARNRRRFRSVRCYGRTTQRNKTIPVTRKRYRSRGLTYTRRSWIWSRMRRSSRRRSITLSFYRETSCIQGSSRQDYTRRKREKKEASFPRPRPCISAPWPRRWLAGNLSTASTRYLPPQKNCTG